MTGIYGTTLARVHAEGWADAFGPAVPWLLGLARSADGAVNGPPVVADLGCGDGALAQALAEGGCWVAASDASVAMVARAKARGWTATPAAQRLAFSWSRRPGAGPAILRPGELPARELSTRRTLDVQHARAAAADLPKGCALVIALGEVLSHIGPDGVSDFAAVVPRAAAALRPGGALVCDLIGPETPEGRAVREGADWRVESVTRREGDVLVREIAVTGPDGRAEAETHRLAVTTPEAALATLAAAGLEAEVAPAFGDAALPPGRVGLVARRPA